jgi:hypothetical protein
METPTQQRQRAEEVLARLHEKGIVTSWATRMQNGVPVVDLAVPFQTDVASPDYSPQVFETGLADIKNALAGIELGEIRSAARRSSGA